MEDRELVRRLKARDIAAIAEFEKQYRDQILTRIARKLLDGEVAAEIWVDVLQAVWSGIHRFDDSAGTPLIAWVSAIARNLTNSEWRRRNRHPKEVPLETEWGAPAVRDRYFLEEEPASKVSPYHPIICDAMNRLNARYEKILRLYAEGHSPADIALAADIAPEHVYVKINQAAKALRKRLLADPRLTAGDVTIPSHTQILAELRKYAAGDPVGSPMAGGSSATRKRSSL